MSGIGRQRSRPWSLNVGCMPHPAAQKYNGLARSQTIKSPRLHSWRCQHHHLLMPPLLILLPGSHRLQRPRREMHHHGHGKLPEILLLGSHPLQHPRREMHHHRHRKLPETVQQVRASWHRHRTCTAHRVCCASTICHLLTHHSSKCTACLLL